MAASNKLPLILFFVASVFIHGALGDIICEILPTNVCAFAISSSGKRCLLENTVKSDGKVDYQCRTSEVVVGSSVGEHIETDHCVEACGVDRKSVGLSSDSLLEPTFTSKLCSSACYHHCPNIVDLYFNLAAGEGVYLPDLCDKHHSNLRRDMGELSDFNAEAPSAEGNVRRGMLDFEADSPSPMGGSARREMLDMGGDDDAASPGPAFSPDSAAAPTLSTADAPRREMVELMSGGTISPSPVTTEGLMGVAPTPSGEDGYDNNAPTPQRSRRAMVELMSGGTISPSPVTTEGIMGSMGMAPSSSDDNAPTPSSAPSS